MLRNRELSYLGNFIGAMLLRVMCSSLVLIGVLVAGSAKDTAGVSSWGAYLPMALFMICEFRHCRPIGYGIYFFQIFIYHDTIIRKREWK